MNWKEKHYFFLDAIFMVGRQKTIFEGQARVNIQKDFHGFS